MAIALARRAHLVRRDPEVVLAGGVFRTDDAGPSTTASAAGSPPAIPDARIVRLSAPPVVGAALIGLDRLGRRLGGPGGRGPGEGRPRRMERHTRGCHAVVAPFGRALVRASPARWHPSPDTPSRSPTCTTHPRSERGFDREQPLRTSPSAAGWIALVIWALFAILALLLTVGVVSAFSRYTSGLGSADAALDPRTSSFTQQSVILDRNGVELARFGGEKRDPVEFKDIPPIVVDAQVAVEDKTFWDNAGFDPLAIVVGRDRQPPRQQPRRLDDHPAARPPAAARSGARRRIRSGRFERKIKEIIQSIRLTEAYPGDRGQAADHRRLPEPELLRQPDVRREGGGRDLLRTPTTWRRRHAGPGGDPGRAGQVAVELRPRQERRADIADDKARPERRRASAPGKAELDRPAGHADRPAPQPDPGAPRRTAGRSCRGTSTARTS